MICKLDKENAKMCNIICMHNMLLSLASLHALPFHVIAIQFSYQEMS